MLRVRIDPRPIDRVTEQFDATRLAELQRIAPSVRAAMRERIVWNVTTGITAGGASDMVRAVLSGVQALGVDTHWLTFSPEPEFLTISKRLHNFVYGVEGDGRDLSEISRQHYEAVLAGQAEQLATMVSSGDVVVLHDPQTAGLTGAIQALGAKVIWRCHLGTDRTNEHTDAAWKFLAPYLESVDALIVSRRCYAPEYAESDRVLVMPPSIDSSATRNVEISPTDVHDTLTRANITTGGDPGHHVEYPRWDGSTGAVRRHFDLVHGRTIIPPGAKLAVQVSRWDSLKDMRGVFDAFVDHNDIFDPRVHLALVGPDPTGAAQQSSAGGGDPEATETRNACLSRWNELDAALQSRVHIISLPQDDQDESAHLVNAIQRRADLVVQKSIQEGFGLTVTEAMWKSRAVVASRVGGLSDQIEHQVNGLLLDDPRDHAECARLMDSVLRDDDLARRLGEAARASVKAHYLGDRHLVQFADILLRLS